MDIMLYLNWKDVSNAYHKVVKKQQQDVQLTQQTCWKKVTKNSELR